MGNSARRDRAKPPSQPSQNWLSSPFPGAVRIEHRPIQFAVLLRTTPGPANVVSFHRDARSAYPPLDHRDSGLLRDRRRGRGVDKPLAVAPPDRNIAPFNCRVVLLRTIPGSEVEHQVVEQPGVPSASATGTVPDGVVHASSPAPVPDQQKARWATEWTTPPDTAERPPRPRESHRVGPRAARAAPLSQGIAVALLVTRIPDPSPKPA